MRRTAYVERSIACHSSISFRYYAIKLCFILSWRAKMNS